jgi:hypothetical protein
MNRNALGTVFDLKTINPKAAMYWVALLLRIQDARGSNADRRTAIMTQNFCRLLQNLV